MQPVVGKPVVGHQNFRFPGSLDQCPSRFRCRTITFQHFEASVEGITMTRAAIEWPDRHEALRRFLGAADMAIFADMAEFDHDRRFKRFVVHHGRNAKQPIWLQKWPGTCAQ